MPTGSLRIGTRGSALARWQAEHIQQLLGDRGAAAELVLIETQGDVKSGPIGAIGTQGVFTKEIQRALLDRRVDLAVHSLKDLPTEPVDGLQLTATPPREQCGDALVSNRFATFPELPAAARIGTGSARRQAQLLHWRSDLDVLDIRGNVDTRLQKLDDGEYDAIILAQAGLMRLGLADRIREVAPKEIILPAVGQGAIGLETRADDRDSIAVVSQLNDAETLAAVTAERSLLAALRGGCLAPVGAWARF
ncbi:MAG: hydroxymethylbilane synthase, partial [Pirellulaceae bacterium]|nr:hydroxymethylbilane synthase [Pirellulaceae bacterium]